MLPEARADAMVVPGDLRGGVIEIEMFDQLRNIRRRIAERVTGAVGTENNVLAHVRSLHLYTTKVLSALTGCKFRDRTGVVNAPAPVHAIDRLQRPGGGHAGCRADKAEAGPCRSLDTTYISGIERGQRNPGLDSLNQLARALGVSLPALLADLRQPRQRGVSRAPPKTGISEEIMPGEEGRPPRRLPRPHPAQLCRTAGRNLVRAGVP